MDQEGMKPDQDLGVETRQRGTGDPARLAVSSRRRAMDRLGEAVRDGRDGPVLITGEPGAGKTWLVERLVDELPAGWRALCVELTSALEPLEFLRLVADALGLPMTDRLGSVRLRIRAALEDDSTDGRSWLLIVDEAHRGSPAVWEELLILAGALGRPSGFSAMIIMGGTELARELATRRHDAWAIRLGLHVHLMPLDLDEARELLGFHGRAGIATEPALEELHRDALGNPRMILRLAESRARAVRTGTRATRPSSGESEARRRVLRSRCGRPGVPSRPYRDDQAEPVRPAGRTGCNVKGGGQEADRPELPSLIPGPDRRSGSRMASSRSDGTVTWRPSLTYRGGFHSDRPGSLVTGRTRPCRGTGRGSLRRAPSLDGMDPQSRAIRTAVEAGRHSALIFGVPESSRIRTWTNPPETMPVVSTASTSGLIDLRRAPAGTSAAPKLSRISHLTANSSPVCVANPSRKADEIPEPPTERRRPGRLCGSSSSNAS